MPRKVYDLKAEFGLDFSKSTATVASETGNNQTLAQSTFPRMWTRMTTRGPLFRSTPLTPAEFMQLSWFDACWGEAVWQGLGGGQNITTGYLNSQNGVEVPWGTYRHTIPAEFSAGEYYGYGTGFTDVNSDSVNTKIEVWHENWLGNPTQRDTFVSGSWGVGGNAGYVEGTTFEGFRLNGRHDASTAIINSTFFSSGLRHWKPGEVTSTHRIWAENYRTRGFEFFGSTPSWVGNTSAFQCVQSGYGFAGCWGATMNLDVISSDACGAMFDMYPLAGSEQGGTINIGAIKNETMVASAGRSFRGQVVGVLRGQFAVNIGVLSGAVGQGLLPALFISDSRLSDGNLQRGHLHIGSMKGFNFQHILHDIRQGRAFPKIGDYQAHSFEFDSVGTGNSLAWQTGSQPITPVTGLATFRVNHQVGSLTAINMTPSATPYQEIIVGPPAFTNIVYLSGSVAPPAPPVPTTVVVSLNPAAVTGTATSQASAAVFDQNGLPVALAGTWSIASGPATINQSGVITPNGTTGVVVVRYTQGAIFGEATLTTSAITPSVPTSVTVSLNPGSINTAQTAQASAQVLDQFGNVMPLSGTWSIVSGSATVTPSGVVTPTGTTPAVVRYTQGSVNGQATLTITQAPAPPPPGPLYDVNFVGQNILSLPGCQTIPAAENWKAGTLTGAVYSTRFGNSTAYNTLQRFTTPINGVRKIVLKNAVINSDSTETPGFKFLNDRTRTNNSRQFFQTGTSSSLAIGSFLPNSTPQNIEIIFATPQSIATLFGSGISGQTNCLWLECTGVAMYANP
jgi:hypothetical protein